MGIPLYRIPEIRSYYGKGEYTGGVGLGVGAGVGEGTGVEVGVGSDVGVDRKEQGQGQGQGQEEVHPKAKALLSNVSFDLEELMTTDAVAGDDQRHLRWVSDEEAMYYGIGDPRNSKTEGDKGKRTGEAEGDKGKRTGEAEGDKGKRTGEAEGGKGTMAGPGTREGKDERTKGFVESLPLAGVPFDLEELMAADVDDNVDVYYGTGDYGKSRPVYGKEAKGFVSFKSPLVGVPVT